MQIVNGAEAGFAPAVTVVMAYLRINEMDGAI